MAMSVAQRIVRYISRATFWRKHKTSEIQANSQGSVKPRHQACQANSRCSMTTGAVKNFLKYGMKLTVIGME